MWPYCWYFSLITPVNPKLAILGGVKTKYWESNRWWATGKHKRKRFVPTNERFVPTNERFVPTNERFVPTYERFVPTN